ncbi:MAG: imidazole glycerol phosphate synthase subunit HisH, partial [Fibrobacteraceae bacterium]|nr:imidazole glycerol phosphate synthase subunit HisH [Fibrobacteraceae bacterium]
MASLVVVDYGAGNLTSVANALTYIGEKPVVSSSPEEIRLADRLVFPGVGAARSAMEVLINKGIGEAITDVVRKGNPVLGICIGCQIILEESE